MKSHKFQKRFSKIIFKNVSLSDVSQRKSRQMMTSSPSPSPPSAAATSASQLRHQSSSVLSPFKNLHISNNDVTSPSRKRFQPESDDDVTNVPFTSPMKRRCNDVITSGLRSPSIQLPLKMRMKKLHSAAVTSSAASPVEQSDVIVLKFDESEPKRKEEIKLLRHTSLLRHQILARWNSEDNLCMKIKKSEK